MKKPIFFFSLFSFIPSLSSNFSTMNSFFTKRWLVPALASALLVLGAQNVQAQCGDFNVGTPTSPVTFSLNLTQMNGTKARLNNNVMTSLGFSINGPCFFEVTTDPTLMAGWTSLPYFYDCTQLGLNILYVRVNGPAGPSTANMPPNFRQLNITVVDNISPLLDAPANIGPLNNTPGQCYNNTVAGTGMSLLAWPMAPPTVVAPGQYSDNCSTALSYLIQNPDLSTSSGMGSVPAGYQFKIGTSTITYTVVDGSGLLASDQFTVTVVDNEPAVINCPMSIAVGTQDPSCALCLQWCRCNGYRQLRSGDHHQ
ncbi:MAG: HYR domain-containing protein [Lewinellaceae bacterium]|nr:HYR domain-containing protein [Lewinellaceae bacterium]